MKSQRMRPPSTKSLKKTPSKSRQKWWSIIILAALLIGYLVWKNNSINTNTVPIESTPSTTEPDSATQLDATPLGNNDNSSNNSDLTLNTDETTTVNQIPNAEAILSAPLPETDGLAKEEIDRLADEKQRFAEQKKLAAEQLVMNKQLTTMKAEQIELLEQQIAQLEAETNGDKQ